MSNPIHVALLFSLLLFWLAPAILAGQVAERKGRSIAVYTIAGLIVGPPVLVVALVIPSRSVA